MPKVFTNRLHAGVIDRRENDAMPRFTYAAGADASRIVALAMPPVPNREFPMNDENFVHPIFAMSLPEGRLREGIEKMFAKSRLPAEDDMALLEIVGRSQIGRLRVAPSLADLDAAPPLSVGGLLKAKGTERLFEELLGRYAQYSGVAGAQPKVLLRDDGSLSIDGGGHFSLLKGKSKRMTAPGTTHIVKFFDPKEHPALASNERICMLAARAAGIPVPNMCLSDDGQRLAVERFDILPDGGYMAFEDCCSLASMQTQQKYKGSYEEVAKALSDVIAPARVMKDMADFFRSLVLSVIVRNGDAHRKNFGVLYNTAGDVRLSPAFDIVTTSAYEKIDDVLALEIGGSARWPDAKALARFAVNHCDMTSKEAREAIGQVAEGVARTRPAITQLIEGAPDEATRDMAKSMLHLWELGLKEAGTKGSVNSEPLPKEEPFGTVFGQ